MKSTIFIPKTIKVGYQNRSGTYTGKLAYVIYYDAKNKLRKQQSWENWRDNKIEPDNFENTPTEGFVLNKKVGGYKGDWFGFRQAYTRIYDPRGFEFEITVPNLLYILENTSCIKGKGLEGEFVYGWDGTELLLIPTSSPDYKELIQYSKMLLNNVSIKGKDLALGGTYRTNKNENWIYLGRFEKYSDNFYDYGYLKKRGESYGKHYYFYDGASYKTLKSLSHKIVQVVSEEPVENYAELMDELEYYEMYSPFEKSEYVRMTIEEINECFERTYWNSYIKFGATYVAGRIEQKHYYQGRYMIGFYNYNSRNWSTFDTLDELMATLQPHKKIEYLKNGKIKKH